MSSFLSNYGVPHVLFERKERPSPLPKAHYLNQRAMETFRQHDMHKEIMERGTPPEHMQRVAWVTSLGGNDRLDRKVVHTIPSFGNDPAPEQAKVYKLDAAARSANLPLSRSEPILHKLAEERNPGNIRFGHSVTDFHDHGDHVEVTVKNTTSGSESKFRTHYLIGADGGRVVGPKIGVQMRGPTNIVDMVTVHFSANLSEYWDDRIFLCYLINGESGTVFESGAIVPVGPTWGKDSEEWVFHFGFALDDDSRFDEAKLVRRIRDLLKLPALQLKVERISHWIIESVLANKYRDGNVFIAGDAAHRRPPTTGLGLNTAIEDAFNLSWKLAMVFNHNADPKILDTYEQERRPVGQRNVDWGLFTFENSAVINSALGLIAGQKERNKARFEAVLCGYFDRPQSSCPGQEDGRLSVHRVRCSWC
jgi:2,4-dichlorophenol 6-monooxygenase